MVLCDGPLRMRFRDGFDREVMMTPGETYAVTIDMGSTANTFLPGHRIRVEITSSCFPRYVRNLNSGGEVVAETESDAVIAHQTLRHGGATPSRVVLPRGEVRKVRWRGLRSNHGESTWLAFGQATPPGQPQIRDMETAGCPAGLDTWAAVEWGCFVPPC